jgi:hypothetical protein
MTSRGGSWQPGGGVTRIYTEPAAHEWKLPRARKSHEGIANGLVRDFVPYVWNIGSG